MIDEAEADSTLVSVVIPVFNSEPFFEETLQSVLEQTLLNWECIIVDDGSEDASVEIAEKFCKMDERFVFYQRMRESKGVSVCRNIGISKAKGKYLIFLDSDDLLSKTCLEERCEELEKRPDLNFAVFQGEAFGLKVFKATHKCDNYLDAFLGFKFPWIVTSPLWRRDFFRKKLIGFDEELMILEDPELHIRALKLNPSFEVFWDRPPDCFYRQHKVYQKVKGENYLSHIASYADLLSSEELYHGLSKSQRNLTRNGYFKMILNIVPPMEKSEEPYFRETLEFLHSMKVIKLFRYQISRVLLQLLSAQSGRPLQQEIIYLWTCIIHPTRFVKLLVIPKIQSILK